MKTPCKAACKNSGGICSGCHRTINEIIGWRDSSEEQRQQIMDTLAGVSSTHTCPACHQPAHCDLAAGKSTCWCFDLEEREAADTGSELCLCRACLEKQPLL
ncbi:cysteine-rich CWC family protein [Vibrio porteresiae]|uniref:Cysteine-rich CWC family protein n=1 Tax=Vibrio porteresiae DSM 19223 TaxID=1123496 RepID=A0ABZ0QI60_9VIBR|nr:cysteine-rich CWC family protein [Vibrio porteresiae]WPC76120.1 cysteine-rich CWC family protein [Vibrio porteresiae DSM 19223]